jgi:prepilin-type processing-associated H-X9-DG protein
MKQRQWMRLDCLLGCLACSGLAVAIGAPIPFLQRESTKAPSCTSNLRQIGTAMRMYVEDHDGWFMPKVGWMDRLAPYTRNTEILLCPTLEKERPSTYAYAMNGALSTKLFAKLPLAPETPFAYDSDQYARNAFDEVTSLPRPGRHKSGNNVGYADGHARWVRDNTLVMPHMLPER